MEPWSSCCLHALESSCSFSFSHLTFGMFARFCYLSSSEVSCTANIAGGTLYKPVVHRHFCFHFYKRVSRPTGERVHTLNQRVFFTPNLCSSNKCSHIYQDVPSVVYGSGSGEGTAVWARPSEKTRHRKSCRVKEVKGRLCFLSSRLCRSWPISIWGGNGPTLLQNKIPGTFSKHDEFLLVKMIFGLQSLNWQDFVVYSSLTPKANLHLSKLFRVAVFDTFSNLYFPSWT